MDEFSTQTTLNIPSLVAFAVISFFAIRYFFFSPSASPTGAAAGSGASSSSRARRPFPSDRVDTVAAMFPQLRRRDIEWDLVRNGGSAQATSDRVLREGRLPPAPPNFQAAYDAPPAAASPAGAGSGTGTGATARGGGQPKRVYDDLITRYRLAGRLSDAPPEEDSGDSAGDAIQSKEKQQAKGGWSANKNERQDLLKRRREEMVLAARRKMEERDRKGKEKAP